jgi:2-C-methyl-D-erythritol 4-phosphate cytidylyltransferase
MENYSLIYIMAGKSSRFKEKTPKQFYKVYNIPIFIYPLLKIFSIKEIDELIFVINKEHKKIFYNEFKKYFFIKKSANDNIFFAKDLNIKYFIFIFLLILRNLLKPKLIKKLIKINKNIINKKIIITFGGDIRQDSIYNGLIKASNSKVIIYESSRPFISKEDFIKIIEDPFDNITYGDKINFTVLIKEERKNEKKEDKNNNSIIENKKIFFIKSILDRESLVNIQLPQKFKKENLIFAHKKAKEEKRIFTDDSSLLFYYGYNVKILEGNPENIKITYKNEIKNYKYLFKKYLN